MRGARKTGRRLRLLAEVGEAHVTTFQVVVFRTPSEELPDIGGPEWYGLPVLRALSEAMRSHGFSTSGLEQYEDADGGFLCHWGVETCNVHLVFFDEDGSQVTWAAVVDARTGCLALRKVDPRRLRPALAAIHALLSEGDWYRLVGWFSDDPVHEDERGPPPAAVPFKNWRESLKPGERQGRS